jgi:leader peptidase (prepilin peptidase)/N-methyltransferase
VGTYILVLGIVIGSFLNVCISRISKNESLLFPGSHCFKCERKLSWYENIPIISYIIIRGRCRNCGSKIPIRYLVIEIITGVLFYIFFLKWGFSTLFYKNTVFISILIVIAGIDLENYYIPDLCSGILILFGVGSSIFTIGIESSLLGAGIYSLFFVLLYGFGEVIKKEIIGFGDIKLALGIGSVLGYESLEKVWLFLNIAFILGAAVGIILIVTKIKSRKDYIPFGIYLSISAIILSYF